MRRPRDRAEPGQRAPDHPEGHDAGDADPPMRGASSSELDGLDIDLLRRRWRSVLGKPAPRTLSRGLMIRILHWREQIYRAGDLDGPALARLGAVLRNAESAGNARAGAGSAARLRPGCVLIREHAGVLHRVAVLEGGFAWQGQTFSSLSAAARAITGTNWNGRRFFGLDRPPKAMKPSPDKSSPAGPSSARLPSAQLPSASPPRRREPVA
jgi:hypothetical protein